MSRLDQHISAVQNRLTLDAFCRALASTLLVGASIVLLAIIADKVLGWLPPRPVYWLGGVGVLAAIAAFWLAWRRRPDQLTAAAAIDQKLGLHEKISTALYARKLDDPFAVAAVRDAETAAGNVVLQLGQRFPLSFPKMLYVTITVALAAWLVAAFVQPMDLFGHEAAQKKFVAQQQAQQQVKSKLENALAVVNSVPQAVAKDEKIQLAKQDLLAQLAKPGTDPAQASRSAMKALQDVGSALEQQVKNNEQYAQAKADEKMWKQIADQPITDDGPVNEVRKELQQGHFDKAVDDLSKVVNNFDKLDKGQQQKAAAQMKQLAQQLENQGNQTPAQQQQQQQQLQQMGMNQQQAQQVQQLMQQAAQGNPQAQQQLQQMAKQAMAQMNNGQGPTAQQKQQAQQMMQQMQAQANNQAQAQQMAQAAQQMAQAMQQAQQNPQAQQQAQQQGQQQGQQQQQQQQANSQQQGQQQQSQSQKGQQQQQQASSQQQQQGQSQSSGQSQGQGMSGAMQQMQAQMQQMQAQASDAQQVAAAQQSVSDSMGQGNGSGGGSDGADSPGQWGADQQPQQPHGDNGKNPGNGGGGGHGPGGKAVKAEAPYTVKKEISPSPDIDTGRLLATSFVKAGSIKGDSKAQLREVAASAIKDPTDEIDQDRVSRQAQSVVRKYFSSMEDDATTPATQPAGN